jgi:SAM-dependent methyltransferase
MKTLPLYLFFLLLAAGPACSQKLAPAVKPASPAAGPLKASIRPFTPMSDEDLEKERARWNYILTDSAARTRVFNTEPNNLLMETVRGRKAGSALDIGMGEGRNALYLAKQGWQVTGVDIADKAMALAEKNAKAAGVPLTTVQQDADKYDWGKNKWDLIVLSYAGGRRFAPQAAKALKKGGIVVLEGFHREAQQTSQIGEDVVFDTNELKNLYRAAGLKILRYEEPMGTADFGKKETRLVRLVAQKP